MPLYKVTTLLSCSNKQEAWLSARGTVVRISEVRGRGLRYKWFIYRNGILDLSSLGGLTKIKAKEYIKKFKNVPYKVQPVYTIGHTKDHKV